MIAGRQELVVTHKSVSGNDDRHVDVGVGAFVSARNAPMESDPARRVCLDTACDHVG
jgi:hypothetical protein